MGERKNLVDAPESAKGALRLAFDNHHPRGMLEDAYRKWMKAEFNLAEFDAMTERAETK